MFTVITAALLGVEAQRSFATLQDARSNITFVPYTPQQRIQVAKEAKLEYYKDKPDIDPIPRAAAIQKEAPFLTDKEFHYRYADLFLSLRDFHTNYEMPSPHRCFTAATAVSFELVDSDDIVNNPKVVVNGFSSFKQVLNLSKDASLIGLGDELVSVDGISFKQYYEANQYKTGGANVFGGYRSALKSLSFHSGLLYPMPETDSVIFKLRSRAKNAEYSVTLPWVAISKNACIAEAQTVLSNSTLVADKATQKAPNQDNKLQQEFNAIFENRQTAVQMNPTDDPIITWGIYKPKNLGIIHMESFLPKNNDAEFVFQVIRGLLVDQLAETSAVVFDIRDNGGGLITMADIIPQLFVPMFKNNNARALVAPLNKKIFTSGAMGADWKEAYSQVKPGDKYTPLVYFDSDESSNMYGGAYFKPVGVLNNGNCYSACDLFSANMQDNSAAWIFGEDATTGAGGANVVEYNGFFSKILREDFPPMPYSDVLKETHQDLRIGWRQTVRAVKNAGKLIEDFGVAADTVVRPSVQDVVQKDSESQWDRIADKLNQIGQEKGNGDVYFQATPQINGQVALGEPLLLNVTASGLTTIQVLDADTNTVLFSKDVVDPTKRLPLALSGDAKISKTGFYRFKVLAFKASKQIVETYRFFRAIPSLASFLTLSAPYTWDFGARPEVALFNKGSTDAQGWKQSGSKLVLNGEKGGEYADNVNSKASIFISKIDQVKLSIKATYDTEHGFDFLRIGYTDSLGDHDLVSSINAEGLVVPGVSGSGKVEDIFAIKPVGNFEVFLHFLSDGGVGGKGVEVSLFELTPAAASTNSTSAALSSTSSASRSTQTASTPSTRTSDGPSSATASPSASEAPATSSAPAEPSVIRTNVTPSPTAVPRPAPSTRPAYPQPGDDPYHVGYTKNYGIDGHYVPPGYTGPVLNSALSFVPTFLIAALALAVF